MRERWQGFTGTGNAFKVCPSFFFVIPKYFFEYSAFFDDTMTSEAFHPFHHGDFMTDAIDVILMASGFSKRFGRENKLLQLFHGKSLVRRALELACSVRLGGEVLFVHGAGEIGRAAEGLPVRAIQNDHPERGMCESVRLGAAASAAAYYLFVPCDQPFLDIYTINAVVARRRPGWIVTPCHRGNPGNPSLFSSIYRRELLELADGKSPRLLKTRHGERVELVEIDDPLPLRDIDTMEDLELLQKF